MKIKDFIKNIPSEVLELESNATVLVYAVPQAGIDGPHDVELFSNLDKDNMERIIEYALESLSDGALKPTSEIKKGLH